MAASTDQVVSKCIDGYGSAIGMPQLCGDWMANQVFWLVVTLVVIFLILSRIALPRIAEVLADRQSTITNYLAASEELKSKAEEYRSYLIEKVAEKMPEKIIKVILDPLMGLNGFQARQLSFALGIPKEAMKDFVRQVTLLSKIAVENDFTLVEINPLILTKDNKVIALDAKVNIDAPRTITRVT